MHPQSLLFRGRLLKSSSLSLLHAKSGSLPLSRLKIAFLSLLHTRRARELDRRLWRAWGGSFEGRQVLEHPLIVFYSLQASIHTLSLLLC